MPIRKEDYPPNWKEISLQVREAAGQRCQWCGVPNGQAIYRVPRAEKTRLRILCTEEFRQYNVDWRYAPPTVFMPGSCNVERTNEMKAKRLRLHGFTRIILTVAHLDRDRTNNALENLAALCQRCHLNHDRQAQHIPHRKYGRNHDREHQKKLDL